MTSDKIPSVLLDRRGSISVRRALNNINDMLQYVNPETLQVEDRLESAFEDVKCFLRHLDES